MKMSIYHDGKVHGANLGSIWGRQDPGGPHVGSMNLAIWVPFKSMLRARFCIQRQSRQNIFFIAIFMIDLKLVSSWVDRTIGDQTTIQNVAKVYTGNNNNRRVSLWGYIANTFCSLCQIACHNLLIWTIGHLSSWACESAVWWMVSSTNSHSLSDYWKNKLQHLIIKKDAHQMWSWSTFMLRHIGHDQASKNRIHEKSHPIYQIMQF